MKWASALFGFSALVGVVVIGAGALSGAAWAPNARVWIVFAQVFIPAASVWLAFSYGAYKGLASDNAGLRFLFWANVGVMFFIFPVGTAVAAAMVWLWRELKNAKVRES